MKFKTCPECKREKTIDVFLKKRSSGLFKEMKFCAECRHVLNERNKKYQGNNPSLYKKSQRKYQQDNKEKVNANLYDWREENKERVKTSDTKRDRAIRAKNRSTEEKETRKKIKKIIPWGKSREALKVMGFKSANEYYYEIVDESHLEKIKAFYKKKQS